MAASAAYEFTRNGACSGRKLSRLARSKARVPDQPRSAWPAATSLITRASSPPPRHAGQGRESYECTHDLPVSSASPTLSTVVIGGADGVGTSPDLGSGLALTEICEDRENPPVAVGFEEAELGEDASDVGLDSLRAAEEQ